MGGQVQPIHYDPASVNKLTKEVCIMGSPFKFNSTTPTICLLT